MSIQSITLKQFRCFQGDQFKLDKPLILIKGKNGSGKTSLLEAIYFAGHLRSFRTNIAKELIYFNNEAFHIDLKLQLNGNQHDLNIGFSPTKKSVKINSKKITSYKDLFSYIRIMCMSEDDLSLIKGSPNERRSFLDSALLIHAPESAQLFRKYRKILANRNALFKMPTISKEMYKMWTEQLWQFSQEIQSKRQELLKRLTLKTNELVKKFIPDCPQITSIYKIKRNNTSLDDILADQSLFEQELRMRRGLFGAHLDDVLISFNHQSSKMYASRGQQKLTVLMLKIAHLKDMQENNRPITAFLLDDFMTDFDEDRLNDLIPLLTSLNVQLIFTSPTHTSPLEQALERYDVQKINL